MLKPVVSVGVELVITALAAVVFTFIAELIIVLAQKKSVREKLNSKHAFNDKELFFTSVFTTMMVVGSFKLLQWQHVF